MKHDGMTITPAPGFMVVKKVEAGKTKGGLLIPGTAANTDTLYVVDVSPTMIFGDKVVPTEVREGDRVWLRPDARAVAAHGFPREHAVVSLDYLIAFARETPS
jgi:co-chaperonin GroES (HSP10)